MTNEVAVPSSKPQLRTIMPTSTVVGQMTSPLATDRGRRHARGDQPADGEPDQKRCRRLDDAPQRVALVVFLPPDHHEHHHGQGIEPGRQEHPTRHHPTSLPPLMTVHLGSDPR